MIHKKKKKKCSLILVVRDINTRAPIQQHFYDLGIVPLICKIYCGPLADRGGGINICAPVQQYLNDLKLDIAPASCLIKCSPLSVSGSLNVCTPIQQHLHGLDMTITCCPMSIHRCPTKERRGHKHFLGAGTHSYGITGNEVAD